MSRTEVSDHGHHSPINQDPDDEDDEATSEKTALIGRRRVGNNQIILTIVSWYIN